MISKISDQIRTLAWEARSAGPRPTATGMLKKKLLRISCLTFHQRYPSRFALDFLPYSLDYLKRHVRSKTSWIETYRPNTILVLWVKQLAPDRAYLYRPSTILYSLCIPEKMQLAMIFFSCLWGIHWVHATPISRSEGIEPRQKHRATSSPLFTQIPNITVTTLAETPKPRTSSPPLIPTSQTSPQVVSSTTLKSTDAPASSVPTLSPAPPGLPIFSPQTVSCDRHRETKTWEARMAIDSLVRQSKKRCVQIMGVRSGEFSCTRVASFGSANIDICAPRGFSVGCGLLANWAREVPDSCAWKPEFFYHQAVTGGMFFPEETITGIYVRIGRFWRSEKIAIFALFCCKIKSWASSSVRCLSFQYGVSFLVLIL